MKKAYVWEGSKVILITDEFANLIWDWDNYRWTDPLTWGNFFNNEMKEELDFCFTPMVYEYWVNAYQVISNNQEKINNLSREYLTDVTLDEFLSYLKGGE